MKLVKLLNWYVVHLLCASVLHSTKHLLTLKGTEVQGFTMLTGFLRLEYTAYGVTAATHKLDVAWQPASRVKCTIQDTALTSVTAACSHSNPVSVAVVSAFLCVYITVNTSATTAWLSAACTSR
jgi:hypothetical protein